MALNSNHTFEELGEIKCSVVEKNCSTERAGFLKGLLELNGFTVVIVAGLPPKSAAKSANTVETNTVEESIPVTETYTIGVTDLSFSPMNAIYNRELKTDEGKIVTSNYWKQSETFSKEESWYWKQ
jgi:hypothetical protein